jgi:tRNA-2-methylthio-N6-dimethylallyladenosine synthase
LYIRPYMKYHIIVYGCQMNISDSERVSAVLESIYPVKSASQGEAVSRKAGRFNRVNYKKTSDINEADLIAVVMCSVRQSAVDRIYGLVRKFEEIKAKNPKLKTILTGCILKRDRKKLIKGFDYIVDIRDIKKLPKMLGTEKTNNENDYLDIAPKYSSKFSANVPIMTGCNNFCSYCVVPYVREREISRPAKKIISEIKNLVKKGCKEIWLLGQNVNSYKDNNTNFPKLLKLINDIRGNFWIRFTSSHPKDFNSEVIDALAIGGKITPYLNLPIQSGDDKVLKSMNRHYTVEDYKNKIKKLREKIPDIAISTDIIVGFPGETKKQFENTAKIFRDIKYDMAYINKYSARAGTAAAKLKDNVSIVEKKRREKVLTEILKQTALEKNKKLIGKKTIVLINENRGDNYFGKNDHYKTIKVKSSKNILGEFVKVKITEATPFILKGKII